VGIAYKKATTSDAKVVAGKAHLTFDRTYLLINQ
jgi:hypothetical protein